MSTIHRTAQGQVIDIGALIAVNETVIAVGNQKVNARGDELGPGGKIIRTRNEIMEEHYRLSQAAKATTQPTITSAAAQESAANATRPKAVAVPDVDPTPVFPDDEPAISDEEIAAMKASEL